nr:hypothetical protein [Kandeliimicrobium roseum]
MRVLGRWLGRALLAAAVLAALLLAPVAWVELACRGEAVAETYEPLLPPEDRRAESRTLLTYPEWHIVHAYEDYAQVIAAGDPHDFRFLRAVAGFWGALCPLSRAAAAHGGATGETKLTIYTIGVSFTAELALKALYEETAGRVATWIRGPERAPLDDLSARQTAEYAAFLRQVPWYRWDFRADARALDAAATGAFRDRERRFALGIEYRGKAAYAKVIEGAVGQVGADALTMRAVVSGVAPEALAAMEGVTVIGARPQGVEIETPRYRAFTRLAERLAEAGGDFVEIAGNDDILVSTLSPAPVEGALHSFARQGFGDVRNLRLVKVRDLADVLRALRTGPETLEHIHDY